MAAIVPSSKNLVMKSLGCSGGRGGGIQTGKNREWGLSEEEDGGMGRKGWHRAPYPP